MSYIAFFFSSKWARSWCSGVLHGVVPVAGSVERGA